MTGETASNSKQGTEMNKRRLDRQDPQAMAERKRSVEQRQKDIALAYRAKDTAAVNRIQRGRMRSLDCRVLAVMAVASNQGGRTAGMDGEVWVEDVDKIRTIEWLGEVMNQPKSYKASLRKTVMIPKPGVEEKRKLRIPTRKDRAAQMTYLMATDPVVESQSDANSFGFRKHRSAREAMHLRRLRMSSKWGPTCFWETDVTKCVDSISHSVRRDLTPNRPYIALLDQWLKAGSWEMGHATVQAERGTPQGGVVSPMLCNVALNGLEAVVRQYKSEKRNMRDCEVVRYADDFVVTLENMDKAKAVIPAVDEFRGKRGLTTKPSKTRLDTIEAGFDFLGWNRKRVKRERPRPGQRDAVLMMTPSKTALARVRDMLREEVRSNQTRPELVHSINPRRRGWCAYYASSSHSKKAFGSRDHYRYTLMKRWELRRNPKRTMAERATKAGQGTWEWKLDDGVTRYRPDTKACNYPGYPKLNTWDLGRKTYHPYTSKPEERITLL